MKSLITTDAKKRLGMLALLLGALSLPAFTQQDIRIVNTGVYKTLANNWTWAGSGPGGIQNFYIFTPTASNVGLCFSIRNNDATAHTFGVNFFTSSDLSGAPLAGNTGAWNQIALRNQADGSQVFTVAATSVLNFSLPSTSASPYVGVQILNSGGAGTASASINEAVAMSGCANASYTALRTNGYFSPIPLCDRSATGTVAGGATTKIITTTPALAVSVCTITLSVSTAVTTNGPYTLRTGTGASCGTNPFDTYTVNLGTAVGNPFFSNGGTGVIGPPTPNDVCIVNGAADGAVRYTVTFLLQTSLP